MMAIALLLILITASVSATLCPGAAYQSDLNTLQDCSAGKSVADWGKCLQCNGVCSRLSSFESGCVLGYGQTIQYVTSRTCNLGDATCNSPFSTVINTTCAAAAQSTAACSTFPLVPVVAGSVGGVVALLFVCAGFVEWRRRQEKADHELRKEKRAQRKAREASNGGNPNGSQPRWRPSFVKRTKAVVNEMSKHTSLRLAQQNGMVVNSGLSPMSSTRAPPPPPPGPGMPPTLVANNSFRSPPPPVPGSAQALVAHNSFHGRPGSGGSVQKTLVTHGSAKTLVSHGSFKKAPPSLATKGSFRGPPPIESHPNFPQMQQGVLQAHNSFHGVPPLQQHGSFSGVPMMPPMQSGMPMMGQGAPMMPPGMAAMPPGMSMVSMPPPQAGPAPLPPPSRNSNVLSQPAGAAPAVPPSRGSSGFTKPGATSVSSSSSEPIGEENSLLAQIQAGKALKKVNQVEKEPPKEEKKKADTGGGGGGLMAELQKKMKKKQGAAVE